MKHILILLTSLIAMTSVHAADVSPTGVTLVKAYYNIKTISIELEDLSAESEVAAPEIESALSSLKSTSQGIQSAASDLDNEQNLVTTKQISMSRLQITAMKLRVFKNSMDPDTQLATDLIASILTIQNIYDQLLNESETN